MVSTSIPPAATFDCFCRSHRQNQQCSHEFLLNFLPMLALLGVLTISITYTELREVLRRVLRTACRMMKRVVHPSSSPISLVHLYCSHRTSHSANVFSLSTVRASVRVIWKAISYATFIYASIYVPIKTLPILTFRQFKAVKKSCKKLIVKNSVENKCRKYQQQCEAWMDDQILRLTFIQNGTVENSHKFPTRSDEKIKIDSLWDYLNSFDKGDGFETFIICLKSSLQNPSFFHLGHYSLLELLTSDPEKLLQSNDYNCNLEIQKIIQENIYWFIELINVQELLPVMDSKGLLTKYDKELLNLKFHTCTYKVDQLLTKVLPTKGHCGYNLFLECLEDEHSHTGHHELAEEIKTELHKHQIHQSSKCSLKEIQIWYWPGLMNTREYIEATQKFIYLGQGNDVRKFFSEIRCFIFTHNTTPEAEAFGLMMKALSFKYRSKDAKLCDLIRQTNQCIDRIEKDDNKRDIKGHWNLILSCWYRHQGNYQKARIHLEQAKPELISGNNRAHVVYNEASLLIETTTVSGKENKKIITLLEDAIRGFQFKSDCINVMQARCNLLIAHCCIGSSLRSPHIVRRLSADLDKANSILTTLAKQLDALPLKLQMNYYTVMCDYHRVHNRKQEAIDCINKGLILDTSNQFKRDQKYLQHRMNQASPL